MKRILFFAFLLGLLLGTQSCLMRVSGDNGNHRGWYKHHARGDRGTKIYIENHDNNDLHDNKKNDKKHKKSKHKR